eukprot:TRINITY_DN70889_c0_g1_i1.p1 TRINITY_DN70889_c0_g1~~TRINITY_DN70889_c0_g1_i1.p1  ORF type:complete len:1619 (-),score=127.34 TRINITY_DN70889_c0_g1_i1:4134-8990(-)
MPVTLFLLEPTIAVYCPTKCSYQLRVSLKSEYEIADGERVADRLKEGEDRLYAFKVPSDSSITSISVNLYIGTANSTNVKMFVTPARDPKTVPSSYNSLNVFPSWLGLTAVAYDGSSDFCRDCIYKILVATKTPTSFVLTYKTNKGVTKLTQKLADVYDSVGIAERNCYQYTLPEDSSKTLSIYLKLYSGFANLYANPKSFPDAVSEFAFSSTREGDTVLSISSDQRDKAHAKAGDYYICVYGDYYSSYNLLVTMEDPDSVKRLPIYSGLTRAMGVEKGKLILFEYFVEDKEKADIEFVLTSFTGDADLFVKYCIYTVNSYGAITNSCDLKKSELYSEDVMRSTSSDSVDYVDTSFEPSMCRGKNVKCSYLIGVLGVLDTKFSLTASSSGRHEIPLTEGVPFFGTVGLHQHSLFTLSVRDSEATSVKIQLTSLSGDADLLVTRDSDRTFKMSSKSSTAVDSVEFVKDNDSGLNTVYHITVRGYTLATYTLVYHTVAPRHKQTTLELYDGRPHRAVFSGPEYFATYSFGVAFPKEDARDIRVFVVPITGEYRIFVGVDYIPTSNNFTWEFAQGATSLLIKSSDTRYRREGIYYVVVTKLFPTNTNPHAYTVKYITGLYSTTLLDGVPEIGNLTRGDIAYYKYFIANVTSDITLSVTPLSGDPDLYISVNASNQLPSSDQYDFVSAAVGADSIVVPIRTVLERNKRCTREYYMGADCGIYIAVKCATDECMYSLQLGNAPTTAQRLIEGMPQFGIVEGGRPEFYVFTPNVTDVPTVISVQSIRGPVKAYLLMVPWGKPISEMPSPEKHKISSQSVANTEVLTVKKDHECNPLCDYYVGVYVDMSESMPGRTEIAEYNIMATSSFTLLSEGRAVVDYVPTGGYKYYKFNVLCTKCTLTISLVPLSEGDPDLYVNKGSILPTKEKANFKSASYKGDILQITSDDVFFKENGVEIRGDYTIAVYGFHNCTYSISATSSSVNVQELTLGMPTHVQQPAGEIKYFAFTSWKVSNIKVSLMMSYGRAIIRANTFQDNGRIDLTTLLPKTESDSRWSSLSTNTNNYLVIPKESPHFLATGIYLIGVETVEPSNYAIVVEYANDTDVSYLDMGRPRRFTVTEGERINLAFLVNSYENITLALYTYHGEVVAGMSTERTGPPMWNLLQNTDLVISSTDPKFRLGKYYLTITAVKDADFVVQVKETAKYSWVVEGLPQTGTLMSKRSAYYLYKVNRLPNDNDYMLNVHVHFSKRLADAKLFVKTATNEFLPSEEHADYTLKYDPFFNALGGNMVINATQSNVVAIGLHVTLNDDTDTVRYTLTAWSSGIILLQPDREYVNNFKKLSESHLYELNLVSPSKVYVEVTPCTGQAEFIVVNNLTDAANPSYNLVKTELNKGRLFGSFDAGKGNHYVKVKPLALGQDNTDTWYMIKIATNTNTDLEAYTLQGNGDITHELLGHEILLDWGPVVKKSEEGKVKEVTYTVFMAQEGKANMVTPCGMIMGKAEMVANIVSKTKAKVELSDDLRGKKLTFNVVAIIPDHWQTLAYNPVTVQFHKSSSEVNVLKIFMVLLVIGIIVGVVYYLRKMKEETQSQPRLVIEAPSAQSEMREIGPISQYHAQSDESFHQLLMT